MFLQTRHELQVLTSINSNGSSSDVRSSAGGQEDGNAADVLWCTCTAIRVGFRHDFAGRLETVGGHAAREETRADRVDHDELFCEAACQRASEVYRGGFGGLVCGTQEVNGISSSRPVCNATQTYNSTFPRLERKEGR